MKKLTARTVLGSVLAAAVAISLAACGSSSPSTTPSSSTTATSGGTFDLGLQAPQGTIDPLTVADYNAMFLVGLATAQLVIENPEGKVLPQLAASWSPSSNGLSWTFHLQPNAKFSNGHPVTPADVVWTFDQILAPKSSSPAASSFSGVVKSVAASGSDAVTFTLDKPYSDFPYLLTGANTAILPAHTDAANWIKNPVGAGQFTIEKYTSGQGATLKKNPYYWDASAVKLGAMDVKFFSDTNSELLAFQSGEIDELQNTPVSEVGSTPHRVDTAGWEKFDGMAFNVTKPPFNDLQVRQAVAWALDRKGIVQAAYQTNGATANDVATFPDYAIQPQGLTQREQDVAKAKQLLASAGVSTPVAFTITTYTTEQTLAQVIQQQLDSTKLFKVSLDVMSSGAYYATGASTPWLNAPVTITDWADRLPTQLENLLYGAKSSWNASHYVNPQLDSLAQQYNQSDSTAQRQRLANRIGQLEWTDVPVIIAAFQKNTVILSTKVQGSFVNGQNFTDGFDFRGISVGP